MSFIPIPDHVIDLLMKLYHYMKSVLRVNVSTNRDMTCQVYCQIKLKQGGWTLTTSAEFLCFYLTLITKPKEHPGTLRSNAPRIWVH